MNKNSESIWQKISLYMFLGLLAYMPLHILLSTWIGTSFGVLEVARVAKEGFLLVGATIALILGIRRGIVRQLLRDRLIQIITAFVALNAVLALWRSTDLDAELLGLAYNVRFLFYFVWAMILAKLYAPRDIIKPAVKLVLAVGAVTIIFGLLQYLLLPDDALKHVGYQRSNGVLPAFHIDDKPDLERIMSTVRDPNSYGSYLLIILGFTSVWALAATDGKRRLRYAAFSGVALLALFWTFSRGAWIGAVGTLAVVGFFFVLRRRRRLVRYRAPILLAITALLLVGFSSLYAFKDSYLVQNVVFHADESTVLEDPNELRLRFWRESAQSVADNPVGGGPGTAGLASIRNDEKTVLNENYYLQMAQETGFIGLVLFLAILFVVAKRLYVRAVSRDSVSVALLAAFAGLFITNFLVHIWANEAVAYTWWGLAGIMLASAGKKRPKSA